MSPSDGLGRIITVFEEFCDGLRRCREADTFIRADWLDAYGRLYRLRERFVFEKENETLKPIEKRALCKVFEEDTFVKGLMTARTIGDHVVQRSGAPVLYLHSEGPLQVTASTSAMAVFAARVVTLENKEGQQFRYDHLRQLSEAERRIRKALESALAARSN